MRSMRYLLPIAVFAVLVALPSCHSTNLDDPDSADVLLEVGTTTVPPVTAQPDTTGTGCTFTVTEGTMQLLNACHQHNLKKLVVISSTLVYGARPNRNL